MPNPQLARDYTIRMQIPEFTCLCPRTGQPDFATLELEYVPDRLCVELKSLKLYIWSFRDRGAFHEAVTNEIADHLHAAVQARFLRLTRALQRARRDLHHRCRGAPTARLATRRARHAALKPSERAPHGAASRGCRAKSLAPGGGFATLRGTPVQRGVRRYNRAFFNGALSCI